jgi:hypothetical protein
MHEADAQFVAVDPVGIWYGLRLSANGKDEGLNIPIFGGLHGDIPLEATAGALIADVIVDRGISAVLDVSQFESDSDRARFARDFAARFFHRKKSTPSAVHIFVEEAQEFIPQNIQRGEEQMLHSWQRLVRLGRNFGIGVSLISQRPQDVNKKALNQTECLFCFQLTGPQERKAVEDWVSDKGLKEDLGRLLPELKQGHAHVWSPVWLNINEEVHIAQKTTFAAGTTPKVGERPVATKPLAPIEMEKLRKDMAATIEKTKSEDPKHLRAELIKTRAELQRLAAAKPATETKVVEKQIITAKDVKGVEAVAQRLEAEGRRRVEAAQKMTETVEKLAESGRELIQTAKNFAASLAAATNAPAPRHIPTPSRPVVTARPRVPAGEGSADVGNSGLRKMLIALAQRPEGLTRRSLGVRAGLSSQSGTFGTYLGKGRSSGWIIDKGDRMFITDDGLAALGSYEPLPTGAALADYWISELGESGAARILKVLIEHKGQILTREQIGELAGLSAQSGTFGTYLGKLRSLELVNGLEASDELFDGALA